MQKQPTQPHIPEEIAALHAQMMQSAFEVAAQLDSTSPPRKILAIKHAARTIRNSSLPAV